MILSQKKKLNTSVILEKKNKWFSVLPNWIDQPDSLSLMTNAWIRLCAALVCSGVPDIIILVSTAPGFGSVIITFASEICKYGWHCKCQNN